VSTNYYLDNEDLRFYIERGFDWSEIIALYEQNFTAEEGHANEEEAKEFFRLVTDYEADGYSLYSRAPANTSRTVSHHHAHLIKLATDV